MSCIPGVPGSISPSATPRSACGSPGSGRAKAKSTVTTWGAVTSQILALRDHLVAEAGDPGGDGGDQRLLEALLLPARGRPLRGDAGQRPAREEPAGRKTDVSDAAWLAQLGAHGLVRGSFVPPEPIRQLRDLTRTRTTITRERAREIQRLEKLLEDAGIKLSSVAS